MSDNPLMDIGDIAATMGRGKQAALALKVRAQRKRAVDMLTPDVGAKSQAQQQSDKQQADQSPEAKAHAARVSALNLMLTPVEEGGALITNKTPVEMLPQDMFSLDRGYSWASMPKALKSQYTEPEGTKFVGFAPWRMIPLQHDIVTALGKMRAQEDEAESPSPSTPPN
jgi:hypothetical protein